MGKTDVSTIRSILQFRFDHQLSMAEIARVSQGTVHNILLRALAAGSTGGACRRVLTSVPPPDVRGRNRPTFPPLNSTLRHRRSDRCC